MSREYVGVPQVCCSSAGKLVGHNVDFFNGWRLFEKLGQLGHRANNFDVQFHSVIDRGDNFSRAVGIPTDYWEETRIERGDDYENAILPSICEKCKRDTAFAVKITKYLESLLRYYLRSRC